MVWFCWPATARKTTAAIMAFSSSSTPWRLVGEWGASFVASRNDLFAFTSVVANYIYTENNLDLFTLG
ncbi:hypothetical protein ACNKHQ_00030 [Shigella flexneri]